MAKKKKEQKPKKGDWKFLSSTTMAGIPEPSYINKFSGIPWLNKFTEFQLKMSESVAAQFPNSFINVGRIPNNSSPLMTMLELGKGIEKKLNPMSHQIHAVLAGTQSNSIFSITNSLQMMLDNVSNSSLLNTLYGKALFPNIGPSIINKSYWQHFIKEDKEIDEVAELLEGIKIGDVPSEDKFDRLIELTQQNVIEQQKTNDLLIKAESWEEKKVHSEKSREHREKATLLLTTISILLSLYLFYIQVNKETTGTKINNEKLEGLGFLFQSLTANDRATTANLCLRSVPNTKSKATILLIIPKNEMVTVSYSIKNWSYVIYTEPKSGDLITGWVSKHYLKNN